MACPPFSKMAHLLIKLTTRGMSCMPILSFELQLSTASFSAINDDINETKKEVLC
jgi:hypothetical protein